MSMYVHMYSQVVAVALAESDARCGVRFCLGSSASSARAESLVGCDVGFSAGVAVRVRMWTKDQFGLCGVLRQKWCGIL
jgi:hypothetical protein